MLSFRSALIKEISFYVAAVIASIYIAVLNIFFVPEYIADVFEYIQQICLATPIPA